MKQQKNRLRRIASNQVTTPEGRCLIQYVVELENGTLANLFPLSRELPNTEWFQGEIVLQQQTDGSVRAYYKGKAIT